LQLQGLEGGQSSSGRVRQGHHQAKAIVLVSAHNTSQQVNPTQNLVLREEIGLPWCLVVIVIIVIAIQGVVLVVVIISVVIAMVYIDILVDRTSTRRTRSTRGSGRRTTAS
jgi:Flp pilus assembly protein TadB